MENIYFQPNKENSEFLAKLEKLDEYTIPQILDRMVDHFRNLPDLENSLNLLDIKTDSLEVWVDEIRLKKIEEEQEEQDRIEGELYAEQEKYKRERWKE